MRRMLLPPPDGSVITPQNPAKRGDYVILYATGLGAVVPPLEDREIPLTALTIQGMGDFKITLDGELVDPAENSVCRCVSRFCRTLSDQFAPVAGSWSESSDSSNDDGYEQPYWPDVARRTLA